MATSSTDLGRALSAIRASTPSRVAVGDLVALKWGNSNGRARYEAIVDEAASDRGVRVMVDGPAEAHHLHGASMWVNISDISALPMPSASVSPGLQIGCTIRASNPSGALRLR